MIEYSYDVYHSADKRNVGKKRGALPRLNGRGCFVDCLYAFLFREPLVQ